MDTNAEVLRILGDLQRSLGRIEGEFVEFRKLSDRVTKLEVWQSWLKGAWAAVMAACTYLWRVSCGK